MCISAPAGMLKQCIRSTNSAAASTFGIGCSLGYFLCSLSFKSEWIFNMLQSLLQIDGCCYHNCILYSIHRIYVVQCERLCLNICLYHHRNALVKQTWRATLSFIYSLCTPDPHYKYSCKRSSLQYVVYPTVPLQTLSSACDPICDRFGTNHTKGDGNVESQWPDTPHKMYTIEVTVTIPVELGGPCYTKFGGCKLLSACDIKTVPVNSTALVSLLFALKKARAAGRNVGIRCLLEVGTRESLLNMQEPTEKLLLET